MLQWVALHLSRKHITNVRIIVSRDGKGALGGVGGWERGKNKSLQDVGFMAKLTFLNTNMNNRIYVVEETILVMGWRFVKD